MLDNSHAASAAAARGLDDHGIADLAREIMDLVGIVGQSRIRSGHARYAGRAHRAFGRDLVPHHADARSAWADEDDAGLRDALGEHRVLGQEAVAGMDRPAPVTLAAMMSAA